MKLHITIEMSSQLQAALHELLQMMRDFDMRHSPEVSITVGADAPDLTIAEVNRIFDNIRPPFRHMVRFRTRQN